MFHGVVTHRAAVFAKASAVLLLCAGAIIYSSECAMGAVAGIKFCFSVLIPSLFPFMALSSFTVNSGIANAAGRPLGKITHALFGLSPVFAPAILLSLIGGYPIGARTTAQLYRSKIADKAECERAAMFAVCAGPGFLVNFVGASLYGNSTIGIILLISQSLSVIITGVIIKIFSKNTPVKNVGQAPFKPMSVSAAIVHSAADSSRGMLTICAFVVLFSAFTGLIGELVPESDIKDFLYILLEVCTAVNKLAPDNPIELIAFAVGFGGLCVHFQIYSSLGELKINKLLFFSIRIIQGAVTALLTHFGLKLFFREEQVFSTASVQNAEIYGGTVISGLALIGIAICFLYSIKNYNHNNGGKYVRNSRLD